MVRTSRVRLSPGWPQTTGDGHGPGDVAGGDVEGEIEIVVQDVEVGGAPGGRPVRECLPAAPTLQDRQIKIRRSGFSRLGVTKFSWGLGSASAPDPTTRASRAIPTGILMLYALPHTLTIQGQIKGTLIITQIRYQFTPRLESHASQSIRRRTSTTSSRQISRPYRASRTGVPMGEPASMIWTRSPEKTRRSSSRLMGVRSDSASASRLTALRISTRSTARMV